MAAVSKRITGTVASTRLAPGSKSDRIGVVLRADGGDEYVLRRVDGNPFRDPVLDDLVGSRITGTGTVTGQTFIMTGWTKEGG